MPRPGSTPLTPEEKTALLSWIAAGAPEVPGQAPPVTPPVEPPVPGLNFGWVKQQVLQPKCLSCHRHADDFDTYADTRPLLVEIQRRIHAIGTDDQMPPAGKPQLTDDELKLLDDWLAAGAPEKGPAITPLPPT